MTLNSKRVLFAREYQLSSEFVEDGGSVLRFEGRLILIFKGWCVLIAREVGLMLSCKALSIIA